MSESNLTIRRKVLAALEGKKGEVFKRHEIIESVLEKFPGTNKSSVMPSDYCYNRINNGIDFEFHLFKWQSRGVYKYLGEDYPYNGIVYWKDSPYGEWKNGKFTRLPK